MVRAMTRTDGTTRVDADGWYRSTILRRGTPSPSASCSRSSDDAIHVMLTTVRYSLNIIHTRTKGNLTSQEYELLQGQAATAAEAAAAATATAKAVAGTPAEPVRLGSILLLKRYSQYFDSMLSGDWTENNNNNSSTTSSASTSTGASASASSQAAPILLQWDPTVIKKVLLFIHGAAEFVESVDDLQAAARAGGYFGIPALLASVHMWVAQNATVETAPALWSFVSSDPDMSSSTGGGSDGDGGGAAMQDGVVAGVAVPAQDWLFHTTDADIALFDFHVKHFAELSQYGDHVATPSASSSPLAEGGVAAASASAAAAGSTDEEEEEEKEGSSPGSIITSVHIIGGRKKRDLRQPPPIHELEATLMHRLLLSGLVSVNTRELMGIVRRYCKARALRGDGSFGSLCRKLSPPCVIFNLETRAMLLGNFDASTITARTFM